MREDSAEGRRGAQASLFTTHTRAPARVWVTKGAKEEIDATYDAITAYLDEKGIDAQDWFVEEYAKDVKDPDDPALNIYVLLK